jgi:outer membrane lipoprotein-sorting protein
MYFRRSLIAAACLAVPLRLAAAQAASPAPLDEAARADLKQIEAYFNGIKTVVARFMQIAESGALAEGQFYLQRPGRMRLDYDDPVPLMILAERGQVIQFDRKLKHVSYIPLSATPAGVLLRESVEFSGDVTVTGIQRASGTLRVTVVQTRDPRAGSITLVFSDRPLQLMNWIVVDGQGMTTRVTLSQMRVDVPIDAKVWRFDDPNAPGARGN